MPNTPTRTRSQRRRPAAKSLGRGDQCGESEDATFSVVVGAHDEHQVLDRDHGDQRPQDQREDAEHVGVGDREFVAGTFEGLTQRVERAGADVAVDDAERAEGEAAGAAEIGTARPSRLCGHDGSGVSASAARPASTSAARMSRSWSRSRRRSGSSTGQSNAMDSA